METAAKLAVTVRAMTSSPSTPPPRSEHPTAYHYAGIVAVIAVLLLVSNVIVIGCCSPSSIMEAIRSCFRSREASSSSDRESGRRIPVSKYRKCGDSDNECSVCLSVFVDGEAVRQLPQCKHSFHAPCIDMWLYSHTACPLCRTNVSAPPPTTSRQSTRSDDASMANVGVASPVR